jgi:hypothetical protein
VQEIGDHEGHVARVAGLRFGVEEGMQYAFVQPPSLASRSWGEG